MSVKYNFLGTDKEKMDFFQYHWDGGIYGLLNSIIGIVLHDSASGMNATAKSVAQYTVNNMKVNSSASNYHNVIDQEGNCYAICGEKYATYSLGDKDMTDTFYPNDHFISIEIAPSLTGGDFASKSDKEKYYKAWQNACKLVADYCVKYDLTEKQVHQHQEYGSTSCPYTMENYFGSYENALAETRKQVKKEIEALKGKKMKETYYFDFTSFDWGQTLLCTNGQKASAVGMLECKKDTYLYTDATCTKRRQKIPKGHKFATCGNVGNGYNAKGYYTHKVVFNSVVGYVCFKAK